MTKITLKFANQTQLFHFLENIANAQHALADKAEQDGTNSETMFSIMALTKIQTEAYKQLADNQS
ncbi:MAG TPA: hypothetical protein DEQ87_13645 [Algoriphagus sp.]|jgi:hypothetical protein|uniref:hypothetical protein n=1 Tax=unclassified Algoriphagus TaxID=2641541 RepID=UPI000C67F702|nr:MULTISPECIES: hypothetical protein [unclassified Algoriphagus]MAL15106.1 hypothetical protein [Algoriphagus sp.]MAN87870.1 hypothetical protein [Algoriphagus sp.]HAH36807.1 hypothetical protein [Algoriphagus sp.]HAS57297.1 hypothetical protein [Algoriphagus sp.]HAZ24980.1 hypothetical protein [Algoriphagus sp.]|tara:strand:- start:341 stop:535 length:195 start_codon:yes stop_codon:yes gene_type:complete